MTDADIHQALKAVRLSLMQRCLVAVEMAGSYTAAVKVLQEIELDIKSEK